MIPSPFKIRDKVGISVPNSLKDVFTKRNEVSDIQLQVAMIKQVLEQHTADPAWAEVDFDQIQLDLANISEQIALAIPYAVCPFCHGKLNCKACAGKGWMSKWRYTHVVPEELRK